jgi:phosphate:Na+ symporter
MTRSLIWLAVGMYGFILGMKWMRAGLERLAIGNLPSILKRFVDTPTKGMLTGLIVSVLLQSSGAVTVITIGLVSVGTLSFADSIGIILGANVGTTVTAQMIALDLDRFALPIFLIGLTLRIFGKKFYRHIGQALVGFGMLFACLTVMTDALQPMTRSAWFMNLLQTSATNPLLGVIAGASLTALVQSSSATTALTIALASGQLVSLEGAIAIVLGNNIGSCITAVIASIGNPVTAKQVATAHILLNALGVAVFLPFIDPFAELNRMLAPTIALQVAMAHTLFNVLSSLAAWPLARPFARFIEWLVPATAD